MTLRKQKEKLKANGYGQQVAKMQCVSMLSIDNKTIQDAEIYMLFEYVEENGNND